MNRMSLLRNLEARFLEFLNIALYAVEAWQ
jgi:hypothetical protein